MNLAEKHNFWLNNEQIVYEDIVKGINWIRSTEEFIESYKTKKWTIHKKYQHRLEFLYRIKRNIQETSQWSIDPIKYLAYLYYAEWYSVNDIHRKFCELWEYENDETLRKFLVNILFWKLREANDRTETSKRKSITSKNVFAILEANKSKQEEAKLWAKKILRDIIGSWFEREISQEYIDSLSTKKEKILYVLKFIFVRNDKEIIDIIKRINSFNKYWYSAIALALQELLVERDIKGFVISKHDIRHIITN